MSDSSKHIQTVRTGLRESFLLAWEVGVLVRDRQLTYLAAGVSYYAFVSVIPLVLLAVAVASFLGGPVLVERVTALVGQQLSASGQDGLVELLTETGGRGGASIIGFLTLVWSGSRLFRALDIAFDEMYVGEVPTSLLKQFGNAIIVIAGIGLAVSLVVVASALFTVLPWQIPFITVVRPVVILVFVGVAFLPVYYVLPPVEVTVREVLPGTAIAAVGWMGLQVGFELYAAVAGEFGVYGILGAVLLFITWLYFASIVVLVGGAVNAVRSSSAPA